MDHKPDLPQLPPAHRGLRFACLSLLPLPILAVTMAGQSHARTAVLVLAFIAAAAVPVLAAIDSFRLARHTRLDYQLKEYNRWYVYVLLLVLPMGGYVGYRQYPEIIALDLY